jgi:hypothetical protein
LYYLYSNTRLGTSKKKHPYTRGVFKLKNMIKFDNALEPIMDSRVFLLSKKFVSIRRFYVITNLEMPKNQWF